MHCILISVQLHAHQRISRLNFALLSLVRGCCSHFALIPLTSAFTVAFYVQVQDPKLDDHLCARQRNVDPPFRQRRLIVRASLSLTLLCLMADTRGQIARAMYKAFGKS
jgi:hypothetical protein